VSGRGHVALDYPDFDGPPHLLPGAGTPLRHSEGSRQMPGNTPLRREWTVIGLVVALLGIPLVMAVYTMLDVPRTAGSVLARELIVFAMAGILLWLIRSREGLGWNSVGLQRPAPANTALWVVLTFFGVGIAFALAMGVASSRRFLSG
jgi:hypothetical protein